MGWRSCARRSHVASLLVAGGLWLAVAGKVVAAPQVWLESSWARVSPTAPASAATGLTISAARGEYESFQIIVHAPGAELTQVNVAAPDLVGPQGTLIGASNLTLYREQYVQVTTPVPNYVKQNQPLGPGWYPDALIPFVDPVTGEAVTGGQYPAAPFDVAADQNQPVWVDVYVPRTAPAGQYQGTFEVTSDQGTASVTLTLVVWNFELPLSPALKSSFGNDVSSSSEVEELLRHRLMPRNVNPAQERTLIDTQGLNCTDVGFWSGADGFDCVMPPPPSVAQFQQAAAQHASDLFLYDYTADEVLPCTNIYSTLQRWGYNLHQTRILNLVTMPPVPALFDDGSGTERSAVDIWVLLPWLYEDYVGDVEFARQKGDSLWSYNCLDQDDYSPKWLLNYDPINYRIQPGFLNQALGLTGLLYWSVDEWTSDPWNDVNTYEGAYPGEGMLVYPGAPGQHPPRKRERCKNDGERNGAMKRVLILMAAFAVAAVAADIAGTWKATAEGPNETMERTFSLTGRKQAHRRNHQHDVGQVHYHGRGSG